MEIETIDRQYADLQSQSERVASEIAALAYKLKAADQSGNQNTREWILDLKEIALAIQAEQNQVWFASASTTQFCGKCGGSAGFSIAASRHRSTLEWSATSDRRLSRAEQRKRHVGELHELRIRPRDHDGRRVRNR